MDDPYANALRAIAAIAAILLLASLGMCGGIMLSSIAKAHSFYDAACCNDRDCEPLAPEKVQVTPNGYVLPNGQTVPFGKERVSPDKDYHWCRYPNTTPIVQPYNEKACFYAPSQGS